MRASWPPEAPEGPVAGRTRRRPREAREAGRRRVPGRSTSSKLPGSRCRVRRIRPVSTSRTVKRRRTLQMLPQAPKEGDRRALKTGNDQPGLRSGPADRRLPRLPFARPEPGTEERWRGVANGDAEEAAVPESVRDATTVKPGLPGGVRAVGRVGLVGEVGDPDEPLVEARNGLQKEVVRKPPDGQPPFPDLRPQERGENAVRDDRLASRVTVAGDPVYGGRRGRLARRAVANLGPRLPAEERRPREHRDQAELRASEEGPRPGRRRKGENEDEAARSSATSPGCGGTRGRGRPGRGRGGDRLRPAGRGGPSQTSPTTARTRTTSARRQERKSLTRKESRSVPNVPVAKACARNSARSPTAAKSPGTPPASPRSQSPQASVPASPATTNASAAGLPLRSFQRRTVSTSRSGPKTRTRCGRTPAPAAAARPATRASGLARLPSLARSATAASVAREARKKAVEGESENARPPFTQTTGRNAARIVPPSAAHPPTSRRPQRKRAGSATQESSVAATVSARNGDGMTGSSPRPIRIQTGNPGAWGERSYRSNRVTAPAKTASSISPGETAIARKRVATTAPRSAATSGKGGSPGRDWEGSGIGKRHSRGVGDRSLPARGSGGKHGARGARMSRCF